MHRVGRVRLYLSIAVILLIESTFLDLASFGGVRPDILLIFVVFAGLYLDKAESIEAGIAGGLLKGLISTGSILLDVTILTSCALFANYCRNKVFKDHFFTQMGLILLIGFAAGAAEAAVRIALENAEFVDVTLYHAFMPAALALSVYTALAAPPVFFIFRRLLRVNANYR
jgi:rod shape-determining protein MreD